MGLDREHGLASYVLSEMTWAREIAVRGGDAAYDLAIAEISVFAHLGLAAFEMALLFLALVGGPLALSGWAFAICCAMASPIMSNRLGMAVTSAGVSLGMSVHFWALEAWSGVAMGAIMIVQGAFGILRWSGATLAAGMIGMGWIAWHASEGILSVLPVVAILALTIARMQTAREKFRIWALGAPVAMIPYGVHVGSPLSVLFDMTVLCVTMIVIALERARQTRRSGDMRPLVLRQMRWGQRL